MGEQPKSSARLVVLIVAGLYVGGCATSLHEVIINGDIDRFNRLMEGRTDLERRAGEAKWTPLHRVCWLNRLQMAQSLVNKGADIEAKTATGATPLYLAVQRKHPDIVRLLLEHGANSEAVFGPGQLTPLHKAAWDGSAETVDILVEHQANIEARTKRGATPLYLAVQQGQAMAVISLLKLSANIEAVFEGGYRPLHKAVIDANAVIVGLLLEHGADPRAQTDSGKMPLDFAQEKGQTLIAAQLRCHLAFQEAVAKGSVQAFTDVIKGGFVFDVSARTKESVRPLFYQAAENTDDVFVMGKFLVWYNSGADVEAIRHRLEQTRQRLDQMKVDEKLAEMLVRMVPDEGGIPMIDNTVVSPRMYDLFQEDPARAVALVKSGIVDVDLPSREDRRLADLEKLLSATSPKVSDVRIRRNLQIVHRGSPSFESADTLLQFCARHGLHKARAVLLKRCPGIE
jgi:ankyrin repeat protein